MQQFREVSRTRTIYSTETHTSDFILYTFWNGKPVQFFQERCCVVMTGCQENKSCSKVLNFLERLDDRIRCTHKETVAVVEPWKDVGGNKSLGYVFSQPQTWALWLFNKDEVCWHILLTSITYLPLQRRCMESSSFIIFPYLGNLFISKRFCP